MVWEVHYQAEVVISPYEPTKTYIGKWKGKEFEEATMLAHVGTIFFTFMGPTNSCCFDMFCWHMAPYKKVFVLIIHNNMIHHDSQCQQQWWLNDLPKGLFKK